MSSSHPVPFMPRKADLHEVFAARLKSVRTALGLSQTAVGVRMGLPEDTSSVRINRYEKAVHPPTLDSAEKVAEALGVPLPALLARDDALAELILGFALLPKAKQAEILLHMHTALGPERAEEVRSKLATPPAKRAGKGAKRT